MDVHLAGTFKDRRSHSSRLRFGAMDPTDLAFAGLARQAEMVRAREVSPRELVELYLERIERLDPKLNAFRVVLAERALAEAGQAEGRAGAGADRLLLGGPVAGKDNPDLAGAVHGHRSGGGTGPAHAGAAHRARL